MRIPTFFIAAAAALLKSAAASELNAEEVLEVAILHHEKSKFTLKIADDSITFV